MVHGLFYCLIQASPNWLNKKNTSHKGKRWSNFISFVYSPVSAALLRISDTSVNTISGATLINSAGKLSESVLLLSIS